jgi:CRP-like cAMP-binding protein
MESRYLLYRHASPSELFEDGQVIFDVGDPGQVMYVVRSGGVELSVGGTVVENLQEGDPFGEMALITDAPRSARAVAVGATELVPIDVKRFKFLVQASPDFSLMLMGVMADRLRAMNERFQDEGGA